jgi:hypothetical protein
VLAVQEAWAEQVVQVVRAAAVVPLAVKQAWAARAAQALPQAREAPVARSEDRGTAAAEEVASVHSELSALMHRRAPETVPAAQEVPPVASAAAAVVPEAPEERATGEAVP